MSPGFCPGIPDFEGVQVDENISIIAGVPE